MENNNEINACIGKNLIYFRKQAGLTQAELAEKINYSDKSVSKWESGNGIPDVYTLVQLAEIYHVSVNDFLSVDTPVQAKRKTRGLRLLVMLLSSGLVWLVATFAFVTLQLMFPEKGAWWLTFIYAVPVNAVLLLIYAAVWRLRIQNFVCVTTIIWSMIVSIYLTIHHIIIAQGVEQGPLWIIFLLGVPLQVLEVLWAFFRFLFEKNKKTKKSAEGKSVQENSVTSA